ncbi:MAG: bifunctional phosphopantothenoylcysteine decarboxylase/phosphopantothenate--cysteine ligase CoaBC [Polyangiaceae bacterium]|nr:bifunctional phosphopantothenoylcysteine decarboxylase/phosphopantothenate--cysteine ligase CoaBC [Polyangiaceae bacterium]
MVSLEHRLLAGRRITLCVTGSVAAYKAVQLLRLLQQAGASLEVILSEHATEFVGASTFSGLLGKPIHQALFDAGSPGELHVTLAQRSELLLVAPATADTLAKLAGGRASDLLSATVLSARCQVWVAPAMHPDMWAHPATLENVRRLSELHGVRFVGPVHGAVASGDVGLGRMAEPEAIVGALARAFQPQDLLGKRFVVTAGPTEEPLDPVRYLGNRSTGKMGYALAQAARERGATVTLISGPVHLESPAGVQITQVETALQMQEALEQHMGPALANADALIMAAAVADFRPEIQSTEKLKKSSTLELKLKANPDLIATIAKQRQGSWPILVAFALETGSDERLLEQARHKLTTKGVDLVVANVAQEALGTETNRAFLVTANGEQALPTLSKSELAHRILDRVAQAFAKENISIR